MTSMRPHASIALPIISSNSDDCDTSVCVQMASAPISPATRSARLALRSATTIFAPSSAKRFAMPSPKPDAAPVMTATLPFSRMFSSPMIEDDRLGCRHVVERLETLLATMTGALEAAEGKFDTAAGTVAIDEHLARTNPLGNSMLTAPVLRPDACHQPVVGAVGEANGFFLAAERKQRQHQAEHFLACNGRSRIDRTEQGRRKIEAAARRIGTDRAPRQNRSAGFLGFRHHRGDPLPLFGADQGAEVEVGFMRAGDQRRKTGSQRRRHFLVDRPLDQYSAAGRAGLPTILDDGV